MINFEQIGFDEANWETAAQIGGMNIFQSKPWLNFLTERQPLKPVIAQIQENGKRCGFFTGLIVEKFGLRILGSPFRGWTTYFMGFNLQPGVAPRPILEAFPHFVFHELGCQYLEVVDPLLKESDFSGLCCHSEHLPWYSLDLRPSESTLFANMKHTCRTNIRQACKNELTIRQVFNLEFAEEYYAQYTEVMRRHALQPAFGLRTVQLMLKHLLPTGNLLLVRADLPNGECIATGLFLAFERMAVFWGAASHNEYQHLRPNEYLTWRGIQLLKARGVETLHFGGYAGQYKEKFNCQDAHIWRLRLASSSILGSLLDFAAAPHSERYRNWILKHL